LKIRYQKFSVAVSLLLVVALGQVYVSIGLAASNASPRVTEATPQVIMGTLTTGGNKPILVNGANAVSGATIPSGATIETPDNAGATIRFGPLGSICIAKNTKLTLEFDRQGNVGTLKVTLLAGCVILNTAKDTTGTLVTPQGTAQQMGPDTASTIDVCSRAGQAPVVNQGAALAAEAGASLADCGVAPAAAVPGFPLRAAFAIAAFGASGLLLLFNGGNPSPSGP